jgi:hypothetical protein
MWRISSKMFTLQQVLIMAYRNVLEGRSYTQVPDRADIRPFSRGENATDPECQHYKTIAMRSVRNPLSPPARVGKAASLGGSVFFLGRTVQFSRQLRFDAATGLIKFNFSPGDVCQHGVQPLGAQQHQSQHQHEK